MHRQQTQHTCPTLLSATLTVHSRHRNLLLPCLQQRTCVPCLSIHVYIHAHRLPNVNLEYMCTACMRVYILCVHGHVFISVHAHRKGIMYMKYTFPGGIDAYVKA